MDGCLLMMRKTPSLSKSDGVGGNNDDDCAMMMMMEKKPSHSQSTTIVCVCACVSAHRAPHHPNLLGCI